MGELQPTAGHCIEEKKNCYLTLIPLYVNARCRLRKIQILIKTKTILTEKE